MSTAAGVDPVVAAEDENNISAPKLVYSVEDGSDDTGDGDGGVSGGTDDDDPESTDSVSRIVDSILNPHLFGSLPEEEDWSWPWPEDPPLSSPPPPTEVSFEILQSVQPQSHLLQHLRQHQQEQQRNESIAAGAIRGNPGFICFVAGFVFVSSAKKSSENVDRDVVA